MFPLLNPCNGTPGSSQVAKDKRCTSGNVEVRAKSFWGHVFALLAGSEKLRPGIFIKFHKCTIGRNQLHEVHISKSNNKQTNTQNTKHKTQNKNVMITKGQVYSYRPTDYLKKLVSTQKSYLSRTRQVKVSKNAEKIVGCQNRNKMQ